jgi:hypothetical protein
MVGTSGSSGERLGLAAPNARSLFAFTCGTMGGGLSIAICTSPAPITHAPHEGELAR